MKILAVYPGRFQPFHKGHGMVYKWLKRKFGSAVVATSNKVELPKSPFNFEEKKQMMELAGVASSDIKQVTNPYIAKEILKDYNPKTTVLVFAVSEKDMAEDPRFSFKPTKSGKPGYLQPYKGNEDKLEPFGDHDKPRGYVVVTPTFNFDVLNKPMTSASEFRANFAKAREQTKKEMITDLYGKYSEKVYNLMASKIKKTKTLKEMREVNIGMTLSRSLMPQVGDSVSFIDYLNDNDIESQKESINPNNLKSSQMEFDFDKIEGMRSQKSDNRIVVSNDDYVLDGHHRWLADKMEERDCDAYRVDLPILELMRVAKEYENKIKGVLEENLDHKTFGPMLDTFVDFASDHLGLPNKPSISFEEGSGTSFGGYNPSTNEIKVVTKNRHPMDIFRTVAHELVHHKQNGEGRITDVAKEGATGSEIENEANAQAGIVMRNFAKRFPSAFEQSYVTEEVLQEGINDQGIFKVVFLAGGPGSGKDYVLSQTIEGHGLTEINSDTAFEFLMNKEGLDFMMPPEEEAERNIARGRAKTITKEKQRLALVGRKGIIVNGTADDPVKIAHMKSEFEQMGYDTMMVFVNTSDDVSRERNFQRGKAGGRKVLDGTDAEGKPNGTEDIRKMKWDAAQKGKPMLKKLFGNKNFIEFDNSADLRTASDEIKKQKKAEMLNIFKQVRSFSVAPPTNPNASDFIEKELVKRGISDYRPSKSATNYGSQKLSSYNPPASQSVMDMAKKMGLQYYGFGRFGKDNTVTHIEKNGQLIMKPKNIREADVNYQFNKMLKENIPADREWGTNSLTNIYKEATPGQTEMKKKIVLKKKVKEDAPPPYGYEFGNNGVGPTFGVVRSPGGLGLGYSLPMNESITKWMNDEKTKNRFAEKYGDLAEQKLLEAAKRLQEMHSDSSGPKSIKKLREAYGKGYVSPQEKIRKAMAQKGVDIDSDKHRKELEKNKAEYQAILDKEKNQVKESSKEPKEMGMIPNQGQMDEKNAIKPSKTISGYKKLVHPQSDFEQKANQSLEEGVPAWQRKEGQNPEGGLNRKGVMSYRRANPGSKLQTAVTTPPSKLKRGSKAAKRRLSFCRRMKGMKAKLTSAKTARDPDSRINKSLRKWNCEE